MRKYSNYGYRDCFTRNKQFKYLTRIAMVEIQQQERRKGASCLNLYAEKFPSVHLYRHNMGSVVSTVGIRFSNLGRGKINFYVISKCNQFHTKKLSNGFFWFDIPNTYITASCIFSVFPYLMHWLTWTRSFFNKKYGDFSYRRVSVALLPSMYWGYCYWRSFEHTRRYFLKIKKKRHPM